MEICDYDWMSESGGTAKPLRMSEGGARIVIVTPRKGWIGEVVAKAAVQANANRIYVDLDVSGSGLFKPTRCDDCDPGEAMIRLLMKRGATSMVSSFGLPISTGRAGSMSSPIRPDSWETLDGTKASSSEVLSSEFGRVTRSCHPGILVSCRCKNRSPVYAINGRPIIKITKFSVW